MASLRTRRKLRHHRPLSPARQLFPERRKDPADGADRIRHQIPVVQVDHVGVVGVKLSPIAQPIGHRAQHPHPEGFEPTGEIGPGDRIGTRGGAQRDRGRHRATRIAMSDDEASVRKGLPQGRKAQEVPRRGMSCR